MAAALAQEEGLTVRAIGRDGPAGQSHLRALPWRERSPLARWLQEDEARLAELAALLHDVADHKYR